MAEIRRNNWKITDSVAMEMEKLYNYNTNMSTLPVLQLLILCIITYH